MHTILKFALFILTVGSFFLALNKDLRDHFRSYLSSNKKQILSTDTKDLLGDGRMMKVLKVRSEKGLFIEIYRLSNTENLPPLFQSIPLPDKSDGYFHVGGHATNMALQDLNGDRRLEILAPTYDENLTAHLNVYAYNEALGQYMVANPEDFPIQAEEN